MGVVAAKLFPIIRQAARPVARGLVAGAVELGYKTSTMVAQAREELDNMVAEARFAQEQPAPVPAPALAPAALPPPAAAPAPEPESLT